MKIINILKKYNIEVIIVAILLLILGYTTFVYLIPFKSYGDIWAHLASVEELKKPFDQIGDPYFESGPKDPHYGPYFVAIAGLSNLMNTSYISLMAVFGILSVVLLYFTSIRAYLTFFPDRKGFRIDKLILFVAIFLLWDSSRISYAGYYSLADIAITIHFPHMFALSLFMIGVPLLMTTFEEQFHVKKFNKSIVMRYFIVGVMGAGILLTHVITGVIFFFTYGVIGLYYLLFKYKLRFNLLFISNIVSVPIAIGIASLWPFFSILAPFQDLQTIHTEQPIVAIFEVSTWFSVAGISFLGLLGVIRTKNKLIVFLLIFLVFILASYLYPIRTSSYWRFFPITLIPLFFLLTEWLSRQKNILRTFVLFMLLVFGFSSFVNKVNSIAFRAPVSQDNFNFLLSIPRDKLVFSDPETSYFLSGLTGNPVLAVNKSHWNPTNVVAAQEQYSDSLSFWSQGHNNQDGHATYVIEKYGIEYVLINKRIYRDYENYAKSLGQNNKLLELYQDSTYLLLQLK